MLQIKKRLLTVLVSQGVISRNYDDSQYDGLILDLLRRRTESNTSNYLYSLSLVAFPL
jgi:hypothetical protein